VTSRQRVPNAQLHALMREAEMSNKGLAARVRALSRADGGGEVSTTHTLVGKWLNGEVRRPSDRNLHLTAKVLSQALGRAAAVRELGYDDVQPEAADSTLEYPASVADSVAALTQLTGHHQRATKLLVVPEAWSDLLVKTMFGDPAPSPVPKDPASLSPAHAQQVRDATEMFATFDHRYGGGQSRPLAAKYLETSVLPLIQHVAPDSVVGREYFQAVASLTLRAGWTAYDVGAHAEAQRYLYHAHLLAQAAEDRAFSAHALACMSHQANYLGYVDHAMHLARGAVTVASSHATPTAMALFHSMEARALASQGNESGVTTALVSAESWLERRRPDDDPDWIWFFDRAELEAEFAHCFRDLGHADLAKHHASAAIAHHGDEFVRSTSFCRSVLAASHILANEPDEALTIANDVVDIATQLQSSRVLSYLTDIRNRLSGFDTRGAAEFNDKLTEVLRLERSPVTGNIIVP